MTDPPTHSDALAKPITLTNPLKRHEHFTPTRLLKRIDHKQPPRNKNRFLQYSPSLITKSIVFPREYKHKRVKQFSTYSIQDQDENPFISTPVTPSNLNQTNQPITKTILSNNFYGRF